MIPEAGEQLELPGISRKEYALDHIEVANRVFVQHMRDVARSIIRERGRVSTDDLRRYCAQRGVTPQHCGAWGVIFRGRDWIAVGHKNTDIATSHGREIRVWTHRDHINRPPN